MSRATTETRGNPLAAATPIESGKAVRLTWADGSSARFHAIWLRDNAQDAATRSPANGQRLITLADVSTDTRIASAGLTPEGGLRLVFLPEGKEIELDAAWLHRRIYDRPLGNRSGWTGGWITRWDARLASEFATASFPEVAASRRALGTFLAQIRRYGFARMKDVPTESGALCRVAELFGYVRETNYGRWFEVRAEVDPTNLAFTNLGLQAHTDNPYRDPAPSMQILACLENDVEGGQSIVVDGFKAAERLQDVSEESFRLLARYPMRFEYAGSKGVRLSAKRPLLELGPDQELLAVRFNSRSVAPLVDVPYGELEAYYAAYRRFSELIEDPSLEHRFRLEPGELFIVDNMRVLHARTPFSGSGRRWLQGCYPDKDGLLSTLAAIEEEEGELG